MASAFQAMCTAQLASGNAASMLLLAMRATERATEPAAAAEGYRMCARSARVCGAAAAALLTR
jgi:hypothetical protein